MNISESILQVLLEPKYRYKGVRVSRIGLPALLPYKKKSISDAIVHLKRKQYITMEGDSMKISPHGKQYLNRRQAMLQLFESPFLKNAPKNLLLTFDIPEPRKAEREWFRRQLRTFGYEMIQKSVWVGPSPLPKEFVSYIKTIKLEEGIKTFKLAKGYTDARKVK